MDIINAIAGSPLLAIVGLVVIVSIVLAPAALSLAGLTGAQIIDLLKSTMQFIISLIHEFRSSNADKQ